MHHSDRLFIGVYPTGIVYADKQIQQHNDYTKVAFLCYESLELQISTTCPPELHHRIKTHADTIIQKRGQRFLISECGQSIQLGKSNRI